MSTTTGVRKTEASAESVLARVLRDACAPDWSVLRSARRIEAYAGSDVAVLRRARARITAGPEGSSLTTQERRALATLTVAIRELGENVERARGDVLGTGPGGHGGLGNQGNGESGTVAGHGSWLSGRIRESR